ncbi:MAG TPA: hypothetical protein VLA95_00950 [Gemmatimonadales bacterium]|nr:hypothetical protein [Gemmatimonadales bacterium]
MRQSAWLAAAIGLVGWSHAAHAQLPALGVPRGMIRLEVGGGIGAAGDRYRDGTREDLLADFASEALGSDVFPELAESEDRFAALLGAPYRFNLGALRANGYAEAGSIRVGVSVGLTPRVTLFANMPFTHTRVRLKGPLDPAGASAGVNPAHPLHGTAAGQQQTAVFLADFTTALGTLDARLQAGDYDGDPALRALAEQSLAEGTALRDGLAGVLADPATASPFAPLDASAEGAALTGSITGLQAILSTDLGIAGFSSLPALPTTGATFDDVDAYVSHPAGPIAAAPLGATSTVFLQGDAEVGAVLTLLDRWDPAERRGGMRLAARGTVRLPTAGSPAENDLLALPPGDGQTDLEVDAALDYGRGAFGARATGRWTVQLAGTQEMRVAPPSVPMPTADRLASVRVDPGDELALGVRPFLRLAPGFALTGRVEYVRRGEDTAEYDGAPLPGVEAGVVTEGSARNLLLLGGGVTFAAPLAEARRMGTPADAFVEVVKVTRSSEGRVDAWLSVNGGVRIRFRAWGAPATP